MSSKRRTQASTSNEGSLHKRARIESAAPVTPPLTRAPTPAQRRIVLDPTQQPEVPKEDLYGFASSTFVERRTTLIKMPDFWVTNRKGIKLPSRHDPNLKRMIFEEYLAKYPDDSFGPRHKYVRDQFRRGWPGFPRPEDHPEGWGLNVKKEGLGGEHYYRPEIDWGGLRRAREQRVREENNESDDS